MTQPSVETTLRVAPPDGTMSIKERLHIERHLAAYHFALGHLERKEIVLDVACGLGVGLRGVLDASSVTVAMDLARTALESVSGIEGLSRVQADACRLPIKSNSVDAVLAFQLIEHVSRDGAVQMLSEFQRVIRPGGTAFVTTPNARWRLLPLQKPWNPYHVKEYRPSEMHTLCRDAKLEHFQLLGLQGRAGAHEFELNRVRQDPLAVYLKLPRRYRWYLSKIRNWKRPMRREELPEMAAGDGPFFEFDDNYSDGLDFMIIIRKEASYLS